MIYIGWVPKPAYLLSTFCLQQPPLSVTHILFALGAGHSDICVALGSDQTFPFLLKLNDGAPCSSAFRWDTVSHRGERVDSSCFDRPLTLDCIEDGGTSTWIIALMTLCSVSSISGISKKNPPWLAAFKSPSFIQTCSYVALHSLILCQTDLRGEKLKVSAFTLFHIDRSNEFLFFCFPSQIHQTPKTCQEQHCWESWF